MSSLIVYVEDNDFVREAVTELLAGPDREVLSFEDAESADAVLRERPAALLVTDVNLAGTSGMELARRVLQQRPSQAVLLCSGHQLPAAAVAALGPNVQAVCKPFEDDELQAVVARLLAAAAPGAHA